MSDMITMFLKFLKSNVMSPTGQTQVADLWHRYSVHLDQFSPFCAEKNWSTILPKNAAYDFNVSRVLEKQCQDSHRSHSSSISLAEM